MKIADSPGFDIDYTTLEHMEVLRTWLQSEGMLHWFPPCNEEEMENFIRIWAGFARIRASITAMIDRQPVGMATLYLMPYRKVAHQTLFQIIVSPEHHRQGIGTSLMRNLKHLAKTYFSIEFIHGEILDENPLIFLLQSIGFEIFARQEKFVKEENLYYPRILMECPLK